MIRNSNGRHERAYLMSLDYEDQGLAAVEEQMLACFSPSERATLLDLLIRTGDALTAKPP